MKREEFQGEKVNFCAHLLAGRGVISVIQYDAYGRVNQEKPEQPLLKVLVIEDEDNIVELIKLGLHYEGFQVESASEGIQGLSAAQRINPDMVILDIGLQPGGIDRLAHYPLLPLHPTPQDFPLSILT